MSWAARPSQIVVMSALLATGAPCAAGGPLLSHQLQPGWKIAPQPDFMPKGDARLEWLRWEHGLDAAQSNEVWHLEGKLSVTRMLDCSKDWRYSSPEDFEQRNPLMLDYRNWTHSQQYEVIEKKVEETTLDGKRAFRVWAILRNLAGGEHWWRLVYIWVPQGNDGTYIDSSTEAFWNPAAWVKPPAPTDLKSRFAEVNDQADAIIASFKLPGSADSSGWRIVFGGLTALAAAAAALAGAFSSSTKGRENRDPKAVVGYILQLSEQSILPRRDQSWPLSVQAWRVRATGAYEPATDVSLSLTSPSGISVQPLTGMGRMEAMVWQTGPFAPGSVLTITATGPSGDTTAQVNLGGGEARLVLAMEPAEKVELIANGKDSLTLIAKLELSDADRQDPNIDFGAAVASIVFRPPAEWGKVSQPVDWAPGSRAVGVQAWTPDPNRRLTPPESFVVQVEAMVGPRRLAETAVVKLARPAALQALPDALELPLGSRQDSTLDAWVTDPGPGTWEFTYGWDGPAAEPAKVALERVGAAHVKIRLSECATDDPSDASPRVYRTLLLTAKAPGCDDLEREVRYTLLREGLFPDTLGLHPDGTFHIAADGSGKSKDLDFRILVKGPDGRLCALPEKLADLRFEPMAEANTAERNLFDFSGLDMAFRGVTPGGTDPVGTWRFAVARNVPADGQAVVIRLKATVAGLDPADFHAEIPFGYEPSKTDPGSQLIEVERQRAQKTIDTFAPPKLRAQLQKLLDEEGPKLGPEGMTELRRRIWHAAAEAVQNERDGYLAEANWNDWIVYVCDWATYTGDIAFGIVASSALGPWGGMGANILKQMMISAIQAYKEGRSAEDWANEQIWSLLYIFEGKVVDVDTFARLSGASKIKCWAVFCCYQFCKSLYQQKDKSIIQAAKDTTWQVRDGLIASWLGEKYAAELRKRNMTQMPKAPAPSDADKLTHVSQETPEPGKPARAGTDKARVLDETPVRKAPPIEMNDTSRALLAGARKGPDGQLIARRGDVLEIMRDPQKVRGLKDAPPEVQAAFDNQRKLIYESHDLSVERYVQDRVPGMADKEVRVIEFRTPGQDGRATLNTDRDFRVCFKDTDPATGKEHWIEIDRRNWEKESHRSFAEATGGPDHSPEAARQWAEQHQQLGTDKYHPEASPDFSDQASVFNETSGRYESRQVEPNINRVKRGETPLLDPDYMGNMYAMKVHDAMPSGEANTEAFVQARKGVAELKAVQEGYALKHEVGALPPKIEEGMRIIEEAKARQADKTFGPEADTRLRAAGFQGGLPDFMNKLGGQWSALKWARPK